MPLSWRLSQAAHRAAGGAGVQGPGPRAGLTRSPASVQHQHRAACPAPPGLTRERPRWAGAGSRALCWVAVETDPRVSPQGWVPSRVRPRPHLGSPGTGPPLLHFLTAQRKGASLPRSLHVPTELTGRRCWAGFSQLLPTSPLRPEECCVTRVHRAGRLPAPPL